MVKVMGLKVIGGVALLRVDDVNAEGVEKLADDVVKRLGNVKAILAYSGVKGPFRLPEAKLIFGEKIGTVIHKEYGVEFEVDPLRVMFCLGNSFERLRLAAMTRSWETVIDMFAGIGQFSLPIAVHTSPHRVYAIEINAEAYDLLVRNVKRNGVEEIIKPILGDCRQVIKEKLTRSADRVLMGYVGGTLEYLDYALLALREVGGIVHVHEVVRKGTLQDFASEVANRTISLGYRCEVVSVRVVKSFSPSKEHVVVDLFASPQRPDA